MPSRTLTIEQKAELAATRAEVERQSAGIRENIEFLRDNARLPPFESDTATPVELLHLMRASRDEFLGFAKHHVPIYLGQCLIDEFNGHWSVEGNPRHLLFGEPFVDGFGNIGYENVYLRLLNLENEQDVARFDMFRNRCRKAFDLRARFLEAFGGLAGSSVPRSELEQQCVDLDVLPKGSEAEHVWRTRVTKYARLLKIKLRRM